MTSSMTTKHSPATAGGFKTFMETLSGQPKPFDLFLPGMDGDEEALINKFVSRGKIVELGCGDKKLFPDSIGVDIIPNGEIMKDHTVRRSIADVIADVTKPLPLDLNGSDTVIASHIFEHCLDSVGTMRIWASLLKEGGRLVIAVPDEAVTSGIPLNPEHCHAFTQESLRNLAEAVGLKQIASESAKNGISFVSCFEKDGVLA